MNAEQLEAIRARLDGAGGEKWWWEGRDFGAICEDILALLTEVELLRARCEMTYCAYCGAQFPANAFHNDMIGAHIALCPDHPMRAVENERDEARAEVERLRALLEAEPEPVGNTLEGQDEVEIEV